MRPDTPVAVDLDAVVKLIDHRRAELQAEATRIGERSCAETPKAFRRRMRGSWTAGPASGRAPQDRHPAQLVAPGR
jgi:hypothetical protein